jgi:acetylornithine deacetylase/succinyl-diaminopimelate desuccinylase-like protein
MSAVSEIIAANRERFLGELKELVSFPSVSGNQAGLDGAANWVIGRLSAMGADVRLLDTGGPAAVYGSIGRAERSLLSYTHYDVQPPDPLGEWESGPFEPTVRDGRLFGRGTSDDKGDTTARLQAVEVYRQAYGEPPVTLKFLIEGEEEVGSPHLDALAAAYPDLLRADGAIWEGGGYDEAERYTLYCGVKGIMYIELRAHGASYDLHSSYAPMAPNPAWRLVHALSTLKDQDDNITIDGLLAHVRPPSQAELDYIRRIPFAGDVTKRTWGIPAFVNDMSDEQALLRFLTAPTCTICGLRSGFIEEGTKTVLPNSALAKLDFRLVPDLTPELVTDLLRKHLDARGFQDIEMVPAVGAVGARSDLDSPVVQAAVSAARGVYGHEPVVYPTAGGSGPMYTLVQGAGTPGAVMVGVGYPGERMHSPNENIRVEDYFRHIEFLVEFIRAFARTS